MQTTFLWYYRPPLLRPSCSWLSVNRTMFNTPPTAQRKTDSSLTSWSSSICGSLTTALTHLALAAAPVSRRWRTPAGWGSVCSGAAQSRSLSCNVFEDDIFRFIFFKEKSCKFITMKVLVRLCNNCVITHDQHVNMWYWNAQCHGIRSNN